MADNTENLVRQLIDDNRRVLQYVEKIERQINRLEAIQADTTTTRQEVQQLRHDTHTANTNISDIQQRLNLSPPQQ